MKAMVQATVVPALAKSARTGHPHFKMGKGRRSKAGPPARFPKGGGFDNLAATRKFTLVPGIIHCPRRKARRKRRPAGRRCFAGNEIQELAMAVASAVGVTSASATGGMRR